MTAKQTSDTVITVESKDWLVKISLGLGGIIALVILAFVYRIEAGIIALAVGTAYAGRIGFSAYHAHRLAQFERRRLEAEVSKAESEAIQAKARSYFVEVNSGTFQLAGIAVERFYPAVSASKLLADVPQLALPEPARLRRLLDVEFIHLLAVGPSGAGKTTVLCHLIDAAPVDALVIVCDPHAQFNRWPARAGEIIGTGRDYPAIDAKLLDLIQIMDRRYNGLESTAQKVLVVCDEWLSVRDKCPNAERFFVDIGSEARKVNMSLVISSISATVDDLAVSGAVRDNLAQLTLSRTLKAQNRGELKWSRRDTELIELPGPYHAGRAPAALAGPDDLLDYDSGPTAPQPEKSELVILEMHRRGESLRAICKEIYGTVGGRQMDEIKAVLAKWGVS